MTDDGVRLVSVNGVRLSVAQLGVLKRESARRHRVMTIRPGAQLLVPEGAMKLPAKVIAALRQAGLPGKSAPIYQGDLEGDGQERAPPTEAAKPRNGRKAPSNKQPKAATEIAGDSGEPPLGLPEIVIAIGEIERIVDETEAALLAKQDAASISKRLFRRGGKIVSIGFSAEPTHDGGTVEAQIIVEAGDYALAERIASSAVFMKYDGRKEKKWPASTRRTASPSRSSNAATILKLPPRWSPW